MTTRPALFQYDTFPGADAGEYDTIVVGAGHNGLVAANVLARAGERVLVVERRSMIGGACTSEEMFPGYLFSTCASFCWTLHPRVIEELELKRYGLELLKGDPDPLYLFDDKVAMGLYLDPEQTRASIARLNAADGDAFEAWMAFWRRATRIVEPFMTRSAPTAQEIERHADEIGERELLRQLRSSSVVDVARSFFKDDRVGAALVGVHDVGDPWTPGSAWPGVYWHSYNFVDVNHEMVIGGMGGVSNAIARSAAAHGVQIELSAGVARVQVEDGRAVGVELADGRQISARRVMANVHPRTLAGMLDEDVVAPPVRERYEGVSTRAGSMKLHVETTEPPDVSSYPAAAGGDGASLRIFRSFEQYRTAWNQAQQGIVPPEPLVGTFATQSLLDPTVAAGPHHGVSIWMTFAPARLAEGTWAQRTEQVTHDVIDYITRYVPNFKSSVVNAKLCTPASLSEEMGLLEGCIRHVDTIAAQYMDTRHYGNGYHGPVEGLYLCGSGSHPGGEVSGLPGFNAAHAALDEVSVHG
jgi:phytoene dehydrogenase-like protein